MDTQQQELVSQQCIDLWRGLYAKRRMLRAAPYWAWDRQGNRLPITQIIDTVQPRTILDYGSGNGRGADILRTRDMLERVRVDEYDPAWPGSERVPTDAYDLVIAFNVLNNVEATHLARVCAHIESLVAKDLLMAIVVPTTRMRDGLIDLWVNRFPGLQLSYASISEPEESIGLTGQTIEFKTIFIWMYRQLEEVVPPQPLIRVKKKGT